MIVSAAADQCKRFQTVLTDIWYFPNDPIFYLKAPDVVV